MSMRSLPSAATIELEVLLLEMVLLPAPASIVALSPLFLMESLPAPLAIETDSEPASFSAVDCYGVAFVENRIVARAPDD